jgi:hypothetical protein
LTLLSIRDGEQQKSKWVPAFAGMTEVGDCAGLLLLSRQEKGRRVRAA